jgi:hypothetical protein
MADRRSDRGSFSESKTLAVGGLDDDIAQAGTFAAGLGRKLLGCFVSFQRTLDDEACRKAPGYNRLAGLLKGWDRCISRLHILTLCSLDDDQV